jgi:hypothetical protein
MNTDLISAGGSEAFGDLFYYGKFGGLFKPCGSPSSVLIFNYILSSTRTGRSSTRWLQL